MAISFELNSLKMMLKGDIKWGNSNEYLQYRFGAKITKTYDRNKILYSTVKQLVVFRLQPGYFYLLLNKNMLWILI